MFEASTMSMPQNRQWKCSIIVQHKINDALDYSASYYTAAYVDFDTLIKLMQHVNIMEIA